MANPRTFIAPGKVVLMGEYAVLDGGTAIVAAVNRGVQCTVSARTEGQHIVAPNTQFVGPALANWADVPAEYIFEAYNPTNTSSKVGLGSSAAATVAALLAGSTWAGQPLSSETLFREGLLIHRAVQGSGSGVDIAASVYGGIIRFQQDTVTAMTNVPFFIIWSGESAKTGPRVEQYLRWSNREAFVQTSNALADSFHNDPVEAIREAYNTLKNMSLNAGIAYATPALEHITNLAKRFGGAAKPSGAGGGDCAIACFPPKVDPAGFLAECKKEGYDVIDATVSRGAHEV